MRDGVGLGKRYNNLFTFLLCYEGFRPVGKSSLTSLSLRFPDTIISIIIKMIIIIQSSSSAWNFDVDEPAMFCRLLSLSLYLYPSTIHPGSHGEHTRLDLWCTNAMICKLIKWRSLRFQPQTQTRVESVPGNYRVIKIIAYSFHSPHQQTHAEHGGGFPVLSGYCLQSGFQRLFLYLLRRTGTTSTFRMPLSLDWIHRVGYNGHVKCPSDQHGWDQCGTRLWDRTRVKWSEWELYGDW